MSETASPRVPLEGWHDARSAVRLEVEGRETITCYGDSVSERAALSETCGVVERQWSELLEVGGDDRERFLNGYLTCEVSLEGGSYGFFTAPKGGVLADAIVSPSGDAFRVVVPRGRSAAIVEHLERFVLVDRVELAVDREHMQWIVAGPRAPRILHALGLQAGELWSGVRGELAGHSIEVIEERPLGVPVFAITVALIDAAAVAESLVGAGAEPVGFDAFEALRIEAGVPRYGIDFDQRHFPQETGLEDAVSYTKGCYLGQEVVARIHYRGHVNHSLRALVLRGRRELPPGTAVRFDGKEVGRLGSSAFVPAREATVGLAILHRKATDAGTTVTLETGDEARVLEPGA